MSVPSPVSVVIPVFNGAGLLRETLESVRSQTAGVLEVIVVDDGSTEPIASVVEKTGWEAVRYVHQEHAGAGAARNRGAHGARGELLSFVDADDLWAPEKLAWQISAWERAPDAGMVFGHMIEFLSPELPQDEARRLRPRFDPHPGLSPTTLLMRRTRFLESGGFSASLRIGEFIDWYAAVTTAGARPLIIPQVVARRRIHANNQGRSNGGVRNQYATILKRALERRRLAEDGSRRR